MDYNEARAKAKELVSKMTAEEKMSQLVYNAPAIERLGINEYNWWNEALHGVARAGTATVFPQAIALAASFSPETVKKCADVISTEARAKYNKSVEYNDRDIFKGLTFWSPNINIFRDPRWGRGHETYGEDPFLTSIIGKAFIEGIQGDGEFLKASACSKHYAVHSGPEKLRHGFNAEAGKKDMEETYLPAFEKTVEAGVTGVMGAYSAVNGVPACANEALIKDKLRGDWGFKGYFVSDCGAISDIYENHKYVETAREAAAAALNAGCDLNCGECYAHLNEAYEEDLTGDEEITKAAENLFTIRYMLGEFEEIRPYSDIGFEKVDCREHRQLNLESALQTAVLIKNESGFLPLDKEKVKSIGVVGPNALSITGLEGNYEGKASEYITPADGIRRVFDKSEIRVSPGCKYDRNVFNSWDGHDNIISDGVAVASISDVTVLCLGLDWRLEGEDGDKESITLPEVQIKLAEAVCEENENTVVIIMAGSSVDIGEKVRSKAKAIIYGWYPGSQGGLALAKILAGEKAPSGRLPITVYYGDTELPEFTDYSMKGRTYRFIETEPLWPFGFGLSYSSVKYNNAEITLSDPKAVKVKVSVSNTGNYDITEKIQVYAHYDDTRCVTPNYQLCAIKPIEINAGETVEAELEIDRYWLKAVTENGERKDPDSGITLYIGSTQPDNRSRELGAPEGIKISLD